MITTTNKFWQKGDSGIGNLLAVMLVIVFIIGFIYVGLPLLQGGGNTGTTIQLPSNVNVQPK